MRTAMIAITTNSSMRVKPRRGWDTASTSAGRLRPRNPLQSAKRKTLRTSTTRTRKSCGGRDPRPAPRSGAANFGLEPRTSVGPVPVGGGRRDAENLGRLLSGQPGKVAEFDELGLLRVGSGELVEGLVEGQ